MIDVSIIIPTYNHLEDCLKPCIESIIQYTDMSNKEIIIVANGCVDNTKTYVESLGYPFKLIWMEEPSGYTKSTNEGIKVANGEYIILLNNDTILLNQEKDMWVNQLKQPFLTDISVGITGPLKSWSEPAEHEFMIFFCAMIHRRVFDKIGLLNEIYSPGAGEDTEFSIEAELAGFKVVQVPNNEQLTTGDGFMVGSFPIYHKGEATVNDLGNWKGIFNRNSDVLRNKYNKKWKLCNHYERSVYGKYDVVPNRERNRYEWAKNNIIGNKVLDIGCSSGFGVKLLDGINNLDYTGIDYDKDIIQYATEQFGELGKFECADITGYDFSNKFYDTIICFECIEHLNNGKNIAQELKKYCKQLLLTVPYNEIPGEWGVHHVLHGLNEYDFNGFEYFYMTMDGEISDNRKNAKLMLMKWEQETEEQETEGQDNFSVTATISTKGRYFTTLPLTLMAIANQTITPEYLIIFDDNDTPLDLREHDMYEYIFSHLDRKNIKWEVSYGGKKGQVTNHQTTLQISKTDLIWRVDDDLIPEPNVLEILKKTMKERKSAAVGGLILSPKNDQYVHVGEDPNSINHLEYNVQWNKHFNSKILDVEHLHCSFLFNKKCSPYGYCKELSPIGHTEETIFTHEIYRNGYVLNVNPEAISWHYQFNNSGIRTGNDTDRKKMYKNDYDMFNYKKHLWDSIDPNSKIIVLNNGKGDHVAFAMILPEIIAKYGSNITIFCCYKDVFDEFNLPLYSIQDAIIYTNNNIEKYDVYAYMVYHNWGGKLKDAFRQIYM